MNARLIGLARRIESNAAKLTTETIEAAPGGTNEGNSASPACALYDLQVALQAFEDECRAYRRPVTVDG